MKKLLIYLILFTGCIGAVWGLPIEKEGLTLYSHTLKKEVSYSIILPAGYEESQEYYPVMYMFHGIGGDHSSWLEYGNVARVMDKMNKEGKIQPFIIVIPDGYLSYYSDTYNGDFPYESFFVREFVPYIDKKYRTRKDSMSRSITGFSMGGFGALTISLRNRDLFGSVIALSSSIRTEKQYSEEGSQKGWDDQWGRIFGGKGETGAQRLTDYYKERSPYHILSSIRPEELNRFGIMLDIGDKEGTLCESNEELHRLLLRKGIRHEWEVRSGGHDFACWNAALPKAFSFANKQFEPENNKKTIAEKKKLSREATIYKSTGTTIYFPEQQKGSARKYPVIYIQGDIREGQQKVLARQFHKMVDANQTWPAILCFIAGDNDLAKTIQEIEQQHPEIRGSQRMRALINFGKSVEKLLPALRQDNFFTGIVCVNAELSEDKAAFFSEAIHSHKRYPRCWLEVLPDFPSYGFSSNLHILLQKSGMDHEFRSRRNIKDNIFSYWEEWIIYLNNRIHV